MARAESLKARPVDSPVDREEGDVIQGARGEIAGFDRSPR
jgi:hypothetical protein